jgi:hypothetical protein
MHAAFSSVVHDVCTTDAMQENGGERQEKKKRTATRNRTNVTQATPIFMSISCIL